MKKTNPKDQLYNLVIAAVFAALIAVFTAYVSIKTGINDGYLHFGDSVIYLAACILPTPYAVAAAALGGALADILGGAAIWAPFTAVIKALNVLPFALVYVCKRTASPQKILNKTTAFMPIVSGLITVFGTFWQKVCYSRLRALCPRCPSAVCRQWAVRSFIILRRRRSTRCILKNACIGDEKYILNERSSFYGRYCLYL